MKFSTTGRDCGSVTGRPQISGDTFTKKRFGRGAEDHLNFVRSHGYRSIRFQKGASVVTVHITYYLEVLQETGSVCLL